MNKDHSDRITNFFRASASSLAPSSGRRTFRAFYSPVSPDPEVTRLCSAVLSEVELQKADRFATPRDRALFIQRRAFRRYCGARALGVSMPLSQISFDKTQNGRPYLRDLPGLRFSFSSCRLGFVGAWASTLGIGIDLEDETREVDAEKLARHFYSKAETSAVEKADGRRRQQAFFRLWTLKEAALKSIGEGLPFGLDAFEFELEPDPRVTGVPTGFGGPEQFSAHVFEGIECCGAMVVRNRLA